MKINELLVKNENPNSIYRGKIFWSWNGDLKKEELIKQLSIIKTMGFGGFFIHSRTGLKTEYLSDTWFELVEEVCHHAKTLDLEVWLYDEDRWPSGTAGGEVTKEKSYQMKFISLYYNDPKDLMIIQRFAYKNVDDYEKVNSIDEVKDGYTYLVFAIEYMQSSTFYNGYTYLDTMNQEAVSAFFNSTLEKYKKHVGQFFGHTIKGIFTDEPHRGPLFTGFGISNDNKFNMCPYTDKLFDTYEQVYNENLIDLLPKLYFSDSPNDTAYRYIETLQKLFINAYIKPYYNWCEENNLMLTGHALHEDNLTAQTSMSGSMMRFYEHMHIPGIDNLTMNNNCYWAAKQCSSVAKMFKKDFVLSEMYAASGWDSGLEQFKQVGDWQAFYGINFRCLHLSMYTMEGEAKRDYPLSILHQSGLVNEWSYLETYFARLNQLMFLSEEVVDILYIHPIYQMWKEVNQSWARTFTLNHQSAIELEEKFMNDFEIFRKSHVSFDYIDPYHLNYAKVIIKQNKPYIKVSDCYYGTIYKSYNLNHPVFDEFERMGGIIIEDIGQINPNKTIHTLDEISVQIRILGDYHVIIAMNFDREKDYLNTKIEVKTNKKYATLYNLRNNELYRLEFNNSQIFLDFYRGSEHVIILSDDILTENLLKDNVIYQTVDKNQYYQYELKEDNVLPLDEVSLEVNGQFLCEGDILNVDQTLRSYLSLPHRNNEMLQPWYIVKYHKNILKDETPIKLSYTFSIGYLPKEMFLAYEGTFDVLVNGMRPLSTKKYYKDVCFHVLDISLCVKKGINTIELSTQFNILTNLEAVYVYGQFGVEMDKNIVKLKSKIQMSNFKIHGLPYYSGKILFDVPLYYGKDVIVDKGKNIQIIKSPSNKKESYTYTYPYMIKLNESKLELSLSPRNMFGPLHQEDVSIYFAAPDSFLNATKKTNILE